MKCDQCEMVSINGIACHEHGCPNRGKVWSTSTETFERVYVCRECDGKHFDKDDRDACCAPEEYIEEEPEIMIVVDGSYGIYVPTRFAAKFRNNSAYCVMHVTPADWDELEKGPDEEGYWDLWAEILDAAVVLDNETGKHYLLEQDGDLFLVEKL